MQFHLAILLLSLFSYQSIYVHGQGPKDIVDTAIDAGNFQTLVRLLTAADLVTTLKGTGPFTVFAPNDAAFSKIPNATIDDLLKPENKEKLADILKYHVLNGNITAETVLAMNLPVTQETVSKKTLIVDKNGDTVKANDASVATPNVFASNGVIHVVDTVLLPPTNIVDTAAGNADFKTLVAALTAAGLVDALKGNGPFTVFAPTDAAFAKLPAGVVDELVKPENKDTLAKILQYHVTSQLITSPAIGRLTLPANITMLAGGVARVSKDGANVKINDAAVTAVDIFNSNGMIHVIDTVILPPLDIVERALISGNFKTLIAALKAADLVGALKAQGPLTVFAPNDDAFNKLPAGVVGELVKTENKATLQNILKYHVVDKQVTSADILAMTLPANLSMLNGNNAVLSKDGTTIKIDSAAITTADISNTNGYIHVVDSVILPPLDIVEKAIVSGNFKTLVTALKAADLVTALKATGPLTVFGPTDDAFAKLPAGTLDDLLKPENKDKLAEILKYHVINGRVSSSDVLAMNLPTQVDTLAKSKPIVDKDGTTVKINDAKVTTADVENTNGLIHIVDTVLIPPTNIVDTATGNANFKTLVAALTAAGLVDALKGNGPFTVFAPTDAAFAKLPAGVVDELVKAENKDTLAKILQYHVTSQLITSPAIGRLTLPANITMLAGGVARVSKDGANVKINDAAVTAVDIFNSNGMIHVIDTVILPPLDIVERALISGNFKTLIAALKAADLVGALKAQGPLTVFAPNDDAFNKLPAGVVGELVKAENKATLQNILKYYVVDKQVTSADILAMTLPANLSMLNGNNAVLSKDGTTIKIDSAAITAADLSNTNGYIHVVDSVILPPLDIVEKALTSGTFNTLITALRAADLVTTLKGDGPFTVFAPNDDAFAKLPNGTLDDLLKPENKNKLVNTLKYHVVKDRKITSDELNPSQNLEMFAGGSVTIAKKDDQITVNGFKIIAKNVETKNGIIHVIEGVLTPQRSSAMSLHSSQSFLIALVSVFFYAYRYLF